MTVVMAAVAVVTVMAMMAAAEMMAVEMTEAAAVMVAVMNSPTDDRGRDAHEKFATAWPAKRPYGRRQ